MQILITVILAIAAILTVFALITKPGSVYANKPEEKKPMEGKIVRFIPDETEPRNADGACGHLEVVREAHYTGTLYDRVIKRLLDIMTQQKTSPDCSISLERLTTLKNW